MTLKVSQGAEDDAAAAVAWYNDQRDELGFEFLDAFQRLLESIEVAPHRFSPVEGANRQRQLRQALMKRFPYRVIYEIQSDRSALVLAVAHVRRHPDYWRHRPSE